MRIALTKPLRAARVFVVTGAGISAESGIATFRGAGGHWRDKDARQLATEAGFRADPLLVWDWYRERRGSVREAKPNPAHVAVTRLAAEAKEFLLLTQNVDDLHARAEWQARPMPMARRVQIHGDLFVTRCVHCDYQRRDVTEDAPGVPTCPKCSSALRPGVVWFGEQLPIEEIERVERFVSAGPCDLTFVIGTTALFGYIVEWARRAKGLTGEVIDINPEETAVSHYATQAVREPAGAALPRIVEGLAN